MVDTDDTRRTTYDGRRTTPWVWHKLPTGELKITNHPSKMFGELLCGNTVNQFNLAAIKVSVFKAVNIRQQC